jgi:hypothetical protein
LRRTCGEVQQYRHSNPYNQPDCPRASHSLVSPGCAGKWRTPPLYMASASIGRSSTAPDFPSAKNPVPAFFNLYLLSFQQNPTAPPVFP